MRSALGALLLAAGLLACNSNNTRPGANFAEPVDVATFKGFTADHADLRTYVAVANARGDELRLVDAQTDRVVLAPVPMLALSVPVAPRPARLVAGGLHDVDGSAQPVALPDVLLVSSTGLVPRDQATHPGEASARLQLVDTWSSSPTVVAEIDLGDAAPGADLLDAVIGPRLDGAGAVVPGAARLYGAMTGGRLVVIDFERLAPATSLGPIGVAAPGPRGLDLGFTATSLALSPDGTRLYAASLDRLPGGAFGVAELAVSGEPPFPAARELPTLAPTTRVIAAMVAPFVAPNQGDLTLDVFAPTPSLRVYAALASGWCGQSFPIGCGLAVIDPVAGGLAADPAGEMPFQAPIVIPGTVRHLAVVPTPAVGLTVESTSYQGYVRLAPGSGQRWTPALAAAATTLGRIYLVDLAHFAVPSDTSLLVGPNRASVASARLARPRQADNDVQPDGTAFLALWYPPVPDAGTDARLTVRSAPLSKDDLASLPGSIRITPGYTQGETWSVTWQGVLPGLSGRQGLARAAAGGPTSLRLQTAGPAGWRDVVRVYDPRLGIRPGDVVVVTSQATDGAGQRRCPVPFDLTVASIDPPSADAPGGSLALVPVPADQQPSYALTDADGVPVKTGVVFADGSEQYQTARGDPTCLDALAGTDVEVSASVRASGLLVEGTTTGYAGRPAFADAPPRNPTFSLAYQPEAALSCPILVDRLEDWPPAPAEVAACQADQAACRAGCDRLLLARKARRQYYVTDTCRGDTAAECNAVWGDLLVFPKSMPVGPMVGFSVGRTVPPADETAEPRPTTTLPPRDTLLQFVTTSGVVPMSRHPFSGSVTVGSVAPGGMVAYDRSAASGQPTGGARVFGAFPADAVLDFGTDEAASNAVTIR